MKTNNNEQAALKPYEKYMIYGPEALSDRELLALIIRSGTKGRNALLIAEDVLEKCGPGRGLAGLHHMDISELKEIPGIGEVKAVKLKCIGELSNRIARQKNTFAYTFTKPDQIASYYMEQLRHLEVEECHALFLDAKCHLLCDKVLSRGTIQTTLLPRRELFLHALRANATQLILVHNHPSGDPTPSQEDIMATNYIFEAATLMEITFLDHIIIGDQKYISLKEIGLFNH